MGLDLGNLNADPVGDGIEDIPPADVGIELPRGECDVRGDCPCPCAVFGLCGGEIPWM